MKILLTAFDPFGGATVNPAWEVVSRLKEDWGVHTVKSCWCLRCSEKRKRW